MLKLKKEQLNQNIFSDVKLPKFLYAKKQITLSSKVCFDGIGLHTGNKVKMVLNPAPPETGIVFRKKLKNKIILIPANFKNVKSTELCTLISDSYGNSVSTVEHILSALYAYEIDNLFIDLDSNEIPVCDGSSIQFIEELEKVTLQEQDSYKKFLKIKKNIEVVDGNKCARVSPFDNTLITTDMSLVRFLKTYLV